MNMYYQQIDKQDNEDNSTFVAVSEFVTTTVIDTECDETKSRTHTYSTRLAHEINT